MRQQSPPPQRRGLGRGLGRQRLPRPPSPPARGLGEGVVCRRRLATACGGAGPGVGRLHGMRVLGAVPAAAREPAPRRLGSRVAAAGRRAAPAACGARWRPRRRVAARPCGLVCKRGRAPLAKWEGARRGPPQRRRS
ncbi:unnamed protein product [Prorocentrum cordatum]|uniref:Uncharacterized protein n=1 Tax=Prorocentrum cordatum TaxID=2364126 RepID=A0ABN9UQR5_9DINO|nr:unnamed protein product [Polarella glacialis]